MEYGLVLRWLVVLLLLGAVTVPMAAAILPRVDHGALSFTIALAVLALVGHLAGYVAFGWPAVVAGLVVLIGGSLLAARRVDPYTGTFVEAGVVFTLGFLLIVAIRAVDPAAAPLPVAIGEKLLDYGLLATLDRSQTLPPEDMWFAGEPVRYYYGGHMTTVLLARLTGTPIAFAYNLGLATFFAALVTAAYGLAGSIAAGHDVSRRLVGGLAAFFVGLAGNLETAARLVVWIAPAGLANWLVDLAGLDPGVASWRPSDFFYFDASRVLPVDSSNPDTFMAATEFPLFAWINGDLHAHMMSQPLVLLVGALLLAYWRLPSNRRWRRRAVIFGALPPVVGLLAFFNGWSYPVVGGLTVLGVAFAPSDPAGLLPRHLGDRLARQADWVLEEVRLMGLAVVVGVVVMLLGVVWTLPYWLDSLPRSRGIAFWEPWTPVGGLLLVHGAFLAAFVPFLGRRIGPGLERPRLVVGATVLVVVGAIALGAPALGLFAPLLVGTWWLLRTRTDVGFEAVLILAGIGLVLIVEVATVDGERFNTIFKPYVEVWLFWAVATGVALARLADGAAGQAPALADQVDIDRARLQRNGTILTVALVVVTAPYAALALPAHFADRSAVVETGGTTLDATAYAAVRYPDEAAAIRWLNARPGQPTIVTAAPGGYRWRPEAGKGASAPASLTGLPTVLGWFHERQYREPADYRERLAHVETIYEGTPEERARLLARYDVQYVYVGPAERARYDLTIEEDQSLAPVFRQNEVVVYEVSPGG